MQRQKAQDLLLISEEDIDQALNRLENMIDELEKTQNLLNEVKRSVSTIEQALEYNTITG